MDNRIITALEHSNYMATISQQQKNLKLKFINESLYAHNGGIFTVSPLLLSMVDLLIRRNQEEAILIDDKNTPIRVSNLSDFFDEILSVYGEATNSFHTEWESLRKARTVERIIKT